MYNSRNTNGYIVRVIEKITEEGTFLKEKRVFTKEEEALRVYDILLEKYPDFKITTSLLLLLIHLICNQRYG